MEHRQALAHGVILDSRYEIERVLGEGGFGITYLAKDTRLGGSMAIKEYFPAGLAVRDGGATVLSSSDTAQDTFDWGLDRFLQEAQTVARLSHPNIVRVERYFRANGTAYMVLEFVEGDNLESWLKALGRPPTQDEIDRILELLLNALETVHQADIVHRDVKPDNVYIRAADGVPLLLDFGAARQELGQHTRRTAAFVSAGYSPPESHDADASVLGPWTDIYGLSATLYRALVGRPPRQSVARMADTTQLSIKSAIENPGQYRPGFLSAIDRGMQVYRKERHQTIADFRRDAFGQGTTGDQPTRIVEAGEPTSRRSDWRGLAVGALAAGLAGVFLYYVYTSFGQQPSTSDTQTTEVGERNAIQPVGGTPDTESYANYRNERFGFSFDFPSSLVRAEPPPANGAGLAFKSDNDEYRISAFATFNADRTSAADLARQTKSDSSVYRSAEVTNQTNIGFTLRATTGGRVVRYHAFLSCAGQLLNVIEFAYPSQGSQSARYKAASDRVLASFKTGRGEDGPADCNPASGTNPNPRQGNVQPRSNPPQRNQSTVPAPGLVLPNALDNAHFLKDRSLNRMGTYGWISNGFRNGYWSAENLGPKGTRLIFECKVGGDTLSDVLNGAPGGQEGRAIWTDVPQVAGNISGSRVVAVTLNGATSREVFDFAQSGEAFAGTLLLGPRGSTPVRQALNEVAAARTVRLRLEPTGQIETFNAREFRLATGPCFGDAVALAWTKQVKFQGVSSATVRNASGHTLVIRCDITSSSRGNGVIVLEAQRPSREVFEARASRVTVSTNQGTMGVDFTLYGVISGALSATNYNLASNGSNTPFKTLLEFLSDGTDTMRFRSDDGVVDTTFPLAGAGAALKPCLDLF
ncbi:MAG: serine/threonine-protein kinase [Pseudomonadota bacterium]